jgi:stage IV sporulation protein FB
MFLEDPGQSSYDLQFRLFDTPVRVHPSFWIGAVIFGWGTLKRDGLFFLLIWVACLFVCVLVHEFGHVIAGRIFGRPGRILLYGMGGLATSHGGLRNRWQQIAVSLAGPGAGFLLLAAVMLAIVPRVGLENALLAPYRIIFDRYHDPQFGVEDFGPVLWAVVWNLLSVNLILGLFNLLPVWPLDGGMVCRELCQLANPGPGLRISLIISLVTATVLAVNAISPELRKSPADPNPGGFIPYLPADMFVVAFMGILAVGSYMLLQTARPSRGPSRYDDDDHRDRVPWERDADWWKRG